MSSTHTDTLQNLRKDILDVSMLASVADGGAIYPYDMMVWAVGKRSLSIVDAFMGLMESQNFIVAASLIRLQLDSVLRMHAATLVPKVHDFAEAVLAGASVRNLRDQDGKRMTDAYLVSRFSERCDWAERVYKETSGYIHLSSKHIYNTFSLPDDEGQSQLAIGVDDSFLPDEVRDEAYEAMIAITREIVLYIYGWAETKRQGAERRGNGANKSE